jgi:cell division protein FtsB
MQNIARETRLLVTYRIDTGEQLAAHKDGLATQFKTLCTNRKRLRHQVRNIQDEEKLAAAKSEIAALSMKIGELRREVKLCEDIEMRSAAMRDKIRRAQENEKTQGKELTKHEPLRGRR